MRIAALAVMAGCLIGGAAHAGITPDQIAAARPSVVIVNVKVKPQKGIPSLPGFDFPGKAEAEAEAANPTLKPAGSGFVIDGQGGFIVTADYLLKDAEEITVTTTDGRSLKAEITGRSAYSGVAVLHVADAGLPALQFCPALPRAGEEVVVIGSAYNMGMLAFTGTVAGTDMPFNEPDRGTVLALNLTIHMGVGGGPVVSSNGCVTAMAVARVGPPGGGDAAKTLGLAMGAPGVEKVSREMIAKAR